MILALRVRLLDHRFQFLAVQYNSIMSLHQLLLCNHQPFDWFVAALHALPFAISFSLPRSGTSGVLFNILYRSGGHILFSPNCPSIMVSKRLLFLSRFPINKLILFVISSIIPLSQLILFKISSLETLSYFHNSSIVLHFEDPFPSVAIVLRCLQTR